MPGEASMLNNVYFLKCLFLLPPTQVERKFDLMGSASRMMLEILTFQFHYGKEEDCRGDVKRVAR